MRQSIVVLSALALMSGAAALAGSEMHSKSGTVRSAAESVKTECSADMKKFCSDITPGDGRMAACLKSKGDQLSDGCNKARATLSSSISEKMDKAKVAFRKNCGSDVQKFCSDVPSGKGRLMDCLSEHQNDLSSSCKNFQTKVNEKFDESLG